MPQRPISASNFWVGRLIGRLRSGPLHSKKRRYKNHAIPLVALRFLITTPPPPLPLPTSSPTPPLLHKHPISTTDMALSQLLLPSLTVVLTSDSGSTVLRDYQQAQSREIQIPLFGPRDDGLMVSSDSWSYTKLYAGPFTCRTQLTREHRRAISFTSANIQSVFSWSCLPSSTYFAVHPAWARHCDHFWREGGFEAILLGTSWLWRCVQRHDNILIVPFSAPFEDVLQN